MIKAVIFDIGGVLIRTENHAFRRLWEEKLRLRPGESEEIVFNSTMGQRAQLGEISDDDLWEWVGRRLELGVQAHEFRKDFWAGDVLDENLIDLIRRLQPVYQTAIISNATDALRDSLTNKLAIADAFDLIVGSAEERVMKPSPIIFQRTLDALGRRAEETLFIDDFQQNVDAAKELGMNTIHYRSGIDVEAQLLSYGVMVSDLKEKRS